jgi:adenine phosphoribosyltransferase
VSTLDQALALVRSIPDYPKPGIIFKDITPLLANAEAFATTIEEFGAFVSTETVVAGIEARGFIFASALANRKRLGFVPIRKAGKLPHTTISKAYGLEYGEDRIEVHADAFDSHPHVLLVDDVLATGGTISAAIDLIKRTGSKVTTVVVLFEIPELGGREKIAREHPDIKIVALTTPK